MVVYEQVLFDLYHTLELLVGGTVVVLSGSFSRFEEHRTVTARGSWGPQPLFFVRIFKIILQNALDYHANYSIPQPQLI